MANSSLPLHGGRALLSDVGTGRRRLSTLMIAAAVFVPLAALGLAPAAQAGDTGISTGRQRSAPSTNVSVRQGGGPHSPDGCSPDAGYSYNSVRSYLYDMVPYSQGPGGHTLSIQITAGVSVTGTVGGQVSGDVNAIVAKAKVDVNASIALQLTASVTYGDSWTVPSTWRWGYLHAGANRDTMNWEYGYYNGACQYIVSRRGTANLPYHIPAFWSNGG